MLSFRITMDALSKFLSLHEVTTKLDWRCELRSPWRLVNNGTPFGIAPYHLFIKGEGLLQIPGEKGIALQAGDIVMLPHGTPHTLHCGNSKAPLPQVLPSRATNKGLLLADGDGQQTEVLCGEFILDPITSHSLIQSLPKLLLLRSHNKELHAHLYQLLQILNKETKEQVPGARLIAEHLSSALFSLLIRGWVMENEMPSHVLRLLTEPRLFPAVQVLLETPARSLQIGELATLCHMSRATFIRLFQSTTGHSPGNLITSIRLLQAAKLLSHSRASISTISGMVGYSSEPAFHRVFRQRMGMSPGAFRRKQQPKSDPDFTPT